MPDQARIWEIIDEHELTEIKPAKLNLEERIENWLEKDVSILSDDLLVIGRQIETDFGGVIDLLCLDNNGDLAIVELKRDKTPREITAQVMDYASWAKDLSNEKITEIANDYFQSNITLDEAFKNKFDSELPEILNESHNMLIVASEIDPSSERIIKYLSETYGVGINAATFQYFKDKNEHELLARVFLIEPEQVEYKSKTKKGSKRRSRLTYEQLEQIAEQKGVTELYNTLVEKLKDYFYFKTTTTSIAFLGKINEQKVTIFHLSPPDSNLDDGLKFRVYFQRICQYLDTSPEKMLKLLPENKKDWIPWQNSSPEYSGYEGYFKNMGEVERFLEGLKGLGK